MDKRVSVAIERRKLSVEGLVQGVGFRPFVFVLAERYRLAGHVLNNSRGVEIEIEADAEKLDAFETGHWSMNCPLWPTSVA